ncbi:putative ripening-related protein 4 [Phragmites australis]|uniref:putative ripening-related protein 4 n=1 Tax=Phragmites australis TaxID=29695 RepID=UPI002D79292A|nr:putative ripening-related protein 4 [Phragmites australis]
MCFSVHEVSAATCNVSGFIHGKGRNCNRETGLDNRCVAGKRYPQFRCSPPVSAKTPAILTRQRVVTLSSGWLRLDGTNRCNKKIRVNANGRSVLAKVVDECDSVNGCDGDHGFEPPCRNNVVNGSPAVWKALRLNETISD